MTVENEKLETVARVAEPKQKLAWSAPEALEFDPNVLTQSGRTGYIGRDATIYS